MNLIELPRNVQFLYEEHLARIEFEALGCTDLHRDGDHWSQLQAHVNGQRAVCPRKHPLSTDSGPKVVPVNR